MAQAKFAVLSGLSHGKWKQNVNVVRCLLSYINDGVQYSFFAEKSRLVT